MGISFALVLHRYRNANGVEMAGKSKQMGYFSNKTQFVLLAIILTSVLTSNSLFAKFREPKLTRPAMGSIYMGQSQAGNSVFVKLPSADLRYANPDLAWQTAIKASKAVNRQIEKGIISKPLTERDYLKHMKNQCLKMTRGVNPVGFGVIFAQMIQEFPEEYGGDLIGYGLAQLGSMDTDDPAWAMHWAEQTLSGDTAIQIAMAVAVQTTITGSMHEVFNDVCNYYMNDPGKALPAKGQKAVGMTAQGNTIYQKTLKNLRARRALTNGGAMAVGMVLSQLFIEWKNDPNVHRCNELKTAKRWKEAYKNEAYKNEDEMAVHLHACTEATRAWFTSEKATDVSAQILSSIISGVGVYMFRELVGAGLEQSIRSSTDFLKQLETKAIANLKAGKIMYTSTTKSLHVVANSVKVGFSGLRAVGAMGGVPGFFIQIGIEGLTTFGMYWFDKTVMRPIVTPALRNMDYQSQFPQVAREVEQSLNYLNSGKTEWYKGKGHKCSEKNEDGYVTRKCDWLPETPIEVELQNLEQKSKNWKLHISETIDEIVNNWQSALNYPDVLMSSGLAYYKAMAKWGSHESYRPAPVSWDFFSEKANPLFKQKFDLAINKLTDLTEGSVKALNSLTDELFEMTNLSMKLQTEEGRLELYAKGFLTSAGIKQAEDKAFQAQLLEDLEIINKANRNLLESIPEEGKKFSFSEDERKNKIKNAIKLLVGMVNDPNSLYKFPARFRPDTKENADFKKSIRVGLRGMTTRYGETDCGTNKSKIVLRKPVMAGDNFHYLCDNNGRGDFINYVASNRIYFMLNEYVGYPFQLQADVEDIEALLYLQSPQLFSPNQLTATTNRTHMLVIPEFAYKSYATLFGNGGIRFYSNLDSFVEGSLCGEPFGNQFVGNVDIPLIEAVKKEGVHVKIGFPRMTRNYDGSNDVLSPCGGGAPMHREPYADYYSIDWMHLREQQAIPYRHSLKYVDGNPKGFNLVSKETQDLTKKQYRDHLDYAFRRVEPAFLENPGLIDTLWQSVISNNIETHFENRALPNRYQCLVNSEIFNKNLIWKADGKYSENESRKPEQFYTYEKLSAMSYMGPTNEPRKLQFSVVVKPEVEAYRKKYLEPTSTPVYTTMARGLYSASRSNLISSSRVLWKIAFKLYENLKAVGKEKEGLELLSQIQTRLWRLHELIEVSWTLKDYLTPKNPKNSSFARQDLAVAAGILNGVLTIVNNESVIKEVGEIEKLKREEEIPTESPEDENLKQLAGKIKILTIEEEISELKDYLSLSNVNYGISSNIYSQMNKSKISRSDNYYSSAIAANLFLTTFEMYQITKIMNSYLNIYSRFKPPTVPNVQIKSVRSSIIEAIKQFGIVFSEIKSNGWSDFMLKGQSSNCDISTGKLKKGSLPSESEVNGEPDQSIQDSWETVKNLLFKINGLYEYKLSGQLALSCADRLEVDNLYNHRPYPEESVRCAVKDSKVSLIREDVNDFIHFKGKYKQTNVPRINVATKERPYPKAGEKLAYPSHRLCGGYTTTSLYCDQMGESVVIDYNGQPYCKKITCRDASYN